MTCLPVTRNSFSSWAKKKLLALVKGRCCLSVVTLAAVSRRDSIIVVHNATNPESSGMMRHRCPFKRNSRGTLVPRLKKTVTRPVQVSDPFVANLLEKITVGKRVVTFGKGETVYRQGSTADAIFFIQSGKVKLTVVSGAGKEAVIGIFGPHSCLGEGALVAQPLRINTATVMESAVLFRIEKQVMGRALLEQSALSEKFIAALLIRNIDLEEDLCDQLFNHSEKRLARVLLKLSRLPQHDHARDAAIPMLSHETLAEMVGTTRSRVTHFMNKFRKLGLIDYNGKLTVRTEMLSDLVLHD
jgi:CRP/FNR family cyclic AMP-dependent transcriptional regulator